MHGMNNTGHILKKIKEGEENTTISDLGFQYVNIYKTYFNLIEGVINTCAECKTKKEYKYLYKPDKRVDEYILCDECHECYVSQSLKDLKWAAEVYDFEIEHSICDKYKEKYKIKINGYYGIIKTTLSEEPNDWSKTPNDLYISFYYIFSDEKRRDEYYTTV
jgi:hypothetical protein